MAPDDGQWFYTSADDLVKGGKLRANGDEELFTLVCDNFLACGMGVLGWKRRVSHGIDLVSHWATHLDEAFALLCIENYFTLWFVKARHC